MGHEVIVATTRLPRRSAYTLNGVHISEFSIFGNQVSGLTGEVKKYQDFVQNGNFDVIMVKAAQQWTFDALWPVLDKLSAAKVFIPCGFSGLYEPAYTKYFQQIPGILRKFDHLIFYASDYRDINFAKENKIINYSILPNGASEIEFNIKPDPYFRESIGIEKEDIILMTVGSFTSLKGHLEVAKAFDLANFGDFNATLILNGNQPKQENSGFIKTLSRTLGAVRLYGVRYVTKHFLKTILNAFGIKTGKNNELKKVIVHIRKQKGKKVMVTDLPRSSLIQAFMTADLFVFASNVEYSPLVLFESAAAGTPFLTVPVGNSEEIANWTNAGIVCPAIRDAKGYTRVDPAVLAHFISELIKDKPALKIMGENGRKNWQEKFTWEIISRQYEKIFLQLLEERKMRI